MVVTVDVSHIYKYPVEFVTRTHFTKYPCEKEKFVQRIETTEHKIIDDLSKEEYYKRIAVCDNVVPSILRSLHILNEKNILLEEELWMNSSSRVCKVRSRNLTWSKYANMWEVSSFKPSRENPQWTVFEQHGTIDIKGIGPFGRIMELFAKQFLHAGVKRSLHIMEHLLNERYSDKVQLTQKGNISMTDLVSQETASPVS